jgi:hypothetical protein
MPEFSFPVGPQPPRRKVHHVTHTTAMDYDADLESYPMATTSPPRRISTGIKNTDQIELVPLGGSTGPRLKGPHSDFLFYIRDTHIST